MAAATKKGRKSNRRRSSSFFRSFAACFGISSKVSADHGDRKSPSAAALPVNDQYIPAPASEIVNSSKEIHVVEDDDDVKEKTADEFMSNKTRDITSEKSKKREEYSRPMIIKRAEKQNSSVSDTWTNQRKLSHSVSLPVPVPVPHQKREKLPAAGGVEKKGKRGKEVAAVGGEFDSTLGAVMISVTLVVMIIWGKICAVVCTAAWFYFVPRFRAKLEQSYANSMQLKNGESSVDLDSWEYKKKVVLQGLLHRNQNL